MDQQTQLEHFRCAVELLGGQRPTARALGVGERTIRALLAGERKLHPGFLADTARALLDHADACRKLERVLSPAFSGNLTQDQRERPPHGNAYHLREKSQRLPVVNDGPGEIHTGPFRSLDDNKAKVDRWLDMPRED